MNSCAQSFQSCPTLCDPTDCSPPGSPVMRFFRQEHGSGLPFPAPGDLPDQGLNQASYVPCTGRRPLPLEPPAKPTCERTVRNTDVNKGSQGSREHGREKPVILEKSRPHKQTTGRPWMSRALQGLPGGNRGVSLGAGAKQIWVRKALQMHSNRSQLPPTPRPGEGGRRAKQGGTVPGSDGVCPGV